ncbi:MAG TPA: site-specific integrase, partial [Streptosporangiaceae bacterium]|nr:site-specific integrase [Streptosporangiaceae bacterium]
DLTAWWRAYTLAGVMLGLRPGELLGLRWEDIDFAEAVIRVRRSPKASKDPSTGKLVLKLEDLKTEQSRRTLAMPAAVAEALRSLRTSQAGDKLRLGRYYTDLGVVFCGHAGQLRWRQNVNDSFKKLCGAAGLGSDWHPHELRHSFVSVLSDHGVDIEDIADAAGHVNSNVTRTVYRHQIADKVTKASAVMDQIFGAGSGA